MVLLACSLTDERKLHKNIAIIYTSIFNALVSYIFFRFSKNFLSTPLHYIQLLERKCSLSCSGVEHKYVMLFEVLNFMPNRTTKIVEYQNRTKSRQSRFYRCLEIEKFLPASETSLY